MTDTEKLRKIAKDVSPYSVGDRSWCSDLYAIADRVEKLEAVRDASWKVNSAAIALKKNKTTAAMHEVFKLIEKMSDALAAAKEPTT